MEECPNGDWVRYGDIAGMAGENERLRKVEEQLLSLLEAGSAAIGKQSGEAHDEACRRVANELARLRKALEAIRCEHDSKAKHGSAIAVSSMYAIATEALRGAAGEVGK